MRKISIALGCACVVLLGSAALATHTVYRINLVKDGVSSETFERDRNTCINAATADAGRNPREENWTRGRTNPKGYLDCMVAKGYRPDPAGYRTTIRSPNWRTTVRLAKNDVSYETFVRDRDACLNITARPQWASLGTSQWITDGYPTPRRFSECMINRGYRPDPNGYPTTL